MKHRRIILTLALLLGAARCVPSDTRRPSNDAGAPRDAGPVDVRDVDATVAGDARPSLDASYDADAGPLDAASPADRDGDGLPDDVDPDPDRANPRLYFDDFDAASADWIFSSVSMAIDPEAGALGVDMIEPFEREGWIGPRPGWGDYVLRARIRVDEVGRAADPRSGHAGAIARVGQVVPSRYVSCEIDLRARRAALTLHENNRETLLGTAPLDVEAGRWLELTFEVRGRAHVCRIGTAVVTGTSDRRGTGSIGFRSFDATFAADWVEVLEILP